MSYCRFSTDDYQSDVYTYEDLTGAFCTHVARFRYVFAEPLPAAAPDDDERASVDRMVAVQRIVEASGREPIGGPFDGETYYDESLDRVLQRLIQLRAAGYRVPQEAMNSIMEELVVDADGMGPCRV